MQHRYVALIIFACTFATLSPLRALARSLPAVVLSEIQWGGSALSTADEWIELTNVSSESVDISSWKITGVASQEAEIVIPPETILPSYATYLIANYALGDAKTVLAVSPDLVTSSVSISNSSLAVTLIDATGTAVDSYSDEETPGVGSSSPHASAERNLENRNWFTAVSSQNLLEGETLGSPGYASFPAIQEEVLLILEDPEISNEILIVEEIISPDLPEANTVPELSSSEVIIEADLSTPEEVIERVEEDDTEVVADVSLETDRFVESEGAEIEIVTLIEPITTETVVSVVEETPTEDPSLRRPQGTAVDVTLPQDDTDSATTAETITITKVLDYSSLRVTEFLSSPFEGNEWVELWNSGDTEIILDGITLVDASQSVTTLSGVLHPAGYTLIENPKGKLNNTDDTITLLLPDGQTLFTLVYGTTAFPAPEKGMSAGLCDDGWHTDLVPSPATKNSCPTTTLQPTTYDTEISHSPTVELSSTSAGAPPTIQGDVPIEENTSSSSAPIAQVATSVVQDAVVLSPEEASSTSEKTSSSTSSAKKAPSKSTVVSVELQGLEGLSSGQRVEVTGVVIAEPGVFGSRIAYLNGVQLYFHKATWPLLPLGTLVRITGTWDYDGDSRRIKISDSSDIEILGSETLEPTSWDNVSAETAGDILVTASGTLVKKEGDVLIFSSLTGKDFRVIDDAETGSLISLRAGDNVTVTGILFPSDGNWVLTPRSSDDVIIATPSVPTQETPSSSLTALTSASQTSPIRSTPLIGGGILASSVSALGYWFFRSKKLSFLFS